MPRRRRWLLATNLALATGVAIAAAGLPAGGAQPASRAHGQYTMVAGEVELPGEASAVYVVDSVNQEMIAIRWNDSRQQLDWIDYRNLAADVVRRPGR